MTERWRDALGRLGREEPDGERIRGLAEGGPRMPEVDPGSGGGRRRILAAALALAVAAGSIAFAAAVFRGGTTPGPGATTPGPVTPPATDVPTTAGTSAPATSIPVISPQLDPAAICDVPAYDPDVTLLVGNEPVEYPMSVLRDPGVPASELDGPAVDALVARLADPAAVHAPTDGWRRIASDTRLETFAAPLRPGVWWIESFAAGPQASWRLADEEIVEQQKTPAQLGLGLQLLWTGDVVYERGRWNDPLVVVNDPQRPDSVDVAASWADVHIYDENNNEVAPSGPAVGSLPTTTRLAPGGTLPVPVALGAKIGPSLAGTFSVVACVPELGLASPVGTLHASDVVTLVDTHVLTYHFTGTAMDALAIGTLSDVNGCLGLRHDGSADTSYVIWPEGYALVPRDGGIVLINPVGEEVASVGDEVSLGGGGAPIRLVEDSVIGGIPDSCRTGG